MNSVQLNQLVEAVLQNVQRQFPHSQSRIFESGTDFAVPREMHPVFFGSFDWHSSVHSHWLLLRALEIEPEGSFSAIICSYFDSQFTAEKVAAEMEFFLRPSQGGFERPYGWAWLLKLVAQLRQAKTASAGIWYQNLSPFSGMLMKRLLAYLPRLQYPIRTGQHNNTAFALLMALEYARAERDELTARLLRHWANEYFKNDVAYPRIEPGGEDFLSPTWQVALLMQQVLSNQEFVSWFDTYLPEDSMPQEGMLFKPVRAIDRADGRLAHLDGLNLSRAWCMNRIASSFASTTSRHQVLIRAAQAHLHASQDAIHEDYMGSHWLGSFLFLALEY